MIYNYSYFRDLFYFNLSFNLFSMRSTILPYSRNLLHTVSLTMRNWFVRPHGGALPKLERLAHLTILYFKTLNAAFFKRKYVSLKLVFLKYKHSKNSAIYWIYFLDKTKVFFLMSKSLDYNYITETVMLIFGGEQALLQN